MESFVSDMKKSALEDSVVTSILCTVDEPQIKADLWSFGPTGGWAALLRALGFPCYPDLWPWPPTPASQTCLLINPLVMRVTHQHFWGSSQLKVICVGLNRYRGKRYEWEQRKGRKSGSQSKCHDSCISTGMPLRGATGAAASHSRGDRASACSWWAS